MRRFGLTLLIVGSLVGLAAATPAFAQRGAHEAQRRPATAAPGHRVDRHRVVFIGGYFYDPYFGPYPWWVRGPYPPFYYPAYYDSRAVVRIIGNPDKLADAAAVYVDGFYAGIVEDFDGFFEGLPLTPGSHEIVLYLDGYRTVRQRVYLSAASSFALHYTPERLAPGVPNEPPATVAPVPAPPEGTFLPPATPPSATADALRPRATTGVAQGTVLLHVQPSDAELRIDGEPWSSSEPGSFVVQLPVGVHRIEVTRSGYEPYSAEVRVANDATSRVNVSLLPERR